MEVRGQEALVKHSNNCIDRQVVAENSAMEYRDRGGSFPQQQPPPVIQNPQQTLEQQKCLQEMLRNVRIIAKPKECATLVNNILNKQYDVVAVDAEGVNLGPKGPMTLLQIATPEKQVYIFDLLSNPALLVEGKLKEILESEKLLKVMHDCRNDSAALYHQFGITLKNVFDTQAAHAVLQQQDHAKPVYKVKNISLATLCEMYGGPLNPRRDQMKALYR